MTEQQTLPTVSATGFLTLKRQGVAVAERHKRALDYEGWLCTPSMSGHPGGPAPLYRAALPVIIVEACLLFVCSDTLSGRS